MDRQAVVGAAVVCVGAARASARALATGEARCGLGGRRGRRRRTASAPGLAHVPLDVVGEHAQEDVGAHARRGPVVDRADLEIDGLDASGRRARPGPGSCRRAPSAASSRAFGRQAGADDVDAVERGLGGDARRSCGQS